MQKNTPWTEVVAKFVKPLLPTPEIRGSNPVVGNFDILLTVFKRQNKGRRGRECPEFF